MTISAGEPETSGSAVLWYPSGCCDHLVNDFCAVANLLCSPVHLDQWRQAAHPTGHPLTVHEAAGYGRDWWHDAAERLYL